MKKIFYLFIPLFFFAGFSLYKNRPIETPVGSPPVTHKKSGLRQVLVARWENLKKISNPEKDWNEHFGELASQMSELTYSPEAIDQDLSDFADKLTLEQLSNLVNTVTSRAKTGDERLLAAELLARSPLIESIELLAKIITTSAESISDTPAVQEEFRAIQMLAIEGISQKATYPKESVEALQNLATTVDNSQMHDRIVRSLWALQGKAPSLEEQDREALTKMLKTRR